MGSLAKRNKLRLMQKRLAIPKRLERRYVGALTDAMGAMHEKAMAWLRPKLSQVAKGDEKAARADAMTSLGNEFTGEVDGLVGALASSVRGPFDALAGNVAEHNARAMKTLGIDLRGTLGATIDHLRDHNVQLMRRAGRAYADDVAGVLGDPESFGLTVDALAARLADRAEVSLSRATLIARDQSSKLNSAISQHRQQAAGITSYTWSGSLDERERETHLANEGQVFSWFSPPVQTGHPGDDVQCLPASEVVVAHDVRKAFRRWYRGELSEIVTASGKTLRATPNHPVLSARGWIAIGELHEGDHVLEVAEERGGALEEHEHEREARIGDVFGALAKDGAAQSVHVRPADFHGDASEGDVDVVDVERRLHVGTRTKGLRKFAFPDADWAHAQQRFLHEFIVRSAATTHRIMSGFRERVSLGLRRAAHAQTHCIASASDGDASFAETLHEHAAFDSRAARDREKALAGSMGARERLDVDMHATAPRSAATAIGVHADSAEFLAQVVGVDPEEHGHFIQGLAAAQKFVRVSRVNRLSFAGHVFNLETALGWYVAQGIVTHNCRCVAVPVLPSDSDNEDE